MSEIEKLRQINSELYEALDELMTMLRREAPGTSINNHRFDDLGIKCNRILAKARGEQSVMGREG